MDTSSDEREEHADVEANNGSQENEVEKLANVEANEEMANPTNSKASSGQLNKQMGEQLNEKVDVMDTINSSLGLDTSVMGNKKAMGICNLNQYPIIGVTPSDEASTNLITETQDFGFALNCLDPINKEVIEVNPKATDVIIEKNNEEADINLKVTDPNHYENSEDDTSPF